MTQTFDDKKCLSKQHFANDIGQAGDETTPTGLSGLIAEFAEKLGGGKPQFVPVINDEYGLYGWCSTGVAEKVKHNGGKILFGWTIWEWPNVLLTAEFHSLWSDQSGTLIDITPKPQGETSIVFVPDVSYPPNFDFDQRPTNRRMRIAQEPDYSLSANVEIANMRPSQVEYETKRAVKKGMSLVEWITQKQQRDPLPPLIDRFINVCNELDFHTDYLSPGGGTFSPDRKFIELSNQKITLLNALHAAVKPSRQ